jgi:hypothetical protein
MELLFLSPDAKHCTIIKPLSVVFSFLPPCLRAQGLAATQASVLQSPSKRDGSGPGPPSKLDRIARTHGGMDLHGKRHRRTRPIIWGGLRRGKRDRPGAAVPDGAAQLDRTSGWPAGGSRRGKGRRSRSHGALAAGHEQQSPAEGSARALPLPFCSAET